eukprot:s978_g21.t1
MVIVQFVSTSKVLNHSNGILHSQVLEIYRVEVMHSWSKGLGSPSAVLGNEVQILVSQHQNLIQNSRFNGCSSHQVVPYLELALRARARGNLRPGWRSSLRCFVHSCVMVQRLPALRAESCARAAVERGAKSRGDH